MCAKAILESRIDEVIFAVTEPKTGAIVSVDNFFEKLFTTIKLNIPMAYWQMNLQRF